jgi:NTP pyrophosphatase (non-canonical NTP hydrolase)
MHDHFDRLASEIRAFRESRGLQRFDTLKDLAAAISIEVSELQEIFLWEPVELENEFVAVHRDELAEELADILIHSLNFAERAGIDPIRAIELKMEKNKTRYPEGKTTRPKKRRDG